MTSVHGITVYGGTFPAEIWHSLYSEGEVPCEEFEKPRKPIVWAPFYGHFTASAARRHGGGGGGSGGFFGSGEEGGSSGAAGNHGYDPNAYAPGAGQKPTPVPPPPPSTGVGAGGAAEEAGGE